MNCTELNPGANILTNTEPKDTGPPEGFIDNTVRVYKMVDGVKTLVRTEEPFPEGWNKPGPFTIANKAESDERREESMGKTSKRQAPTNLEQAWIESGYVIDKLAKAYGCGWGTARGWLREAGLIDNFGTRILQTSEPAPAANQEPAQSEAPAATSIAEKPQYEPEDNDFTIEDDEPIPYIVAPAFDLDQFTLEIIESTIAIADVFSAPAKVTLAMIGLVLDVEGWL